MDRARYSPDWDRGEGARLGGGRWNAPEQAVVYASLDPSTAIVEVAVHKSFAILDVEPHVLTSFTIPDPGDVHVVDPGDIPNPNWLTPAPPSHGQRLFGERLLSQHLFVVMPSVVSRRSWNVMFDPKRASGRYTLRRQEPFALDPRLHPPQP